ncbi:MAG: hypothetical protein ACO3B4_06460 [Burkholderiaceae bacterium]
MDDPADQPSVPAQGDGAAPSNSPAQPKGLKRRLRWSTRGGEIIRSGGPHEVTVVEGSGNATGRRATPQSDETRALGKDRIAFGPTGGGAFGRDRFAGGDTSLAPAGSAAQGPTLEAERLRDRFAGGSAGAGITDRMLGADRQAPNTGSAAGPVLGATQFTDDYRGGPAGGGIQDRNAGGMAGGGIRDRMLGADGQAANTGAADGPVLGATQLTDDYRGGPGGLGIQDRLAGGMSNGGIQDRNAGGTGSEGIQDRNAGGMGAGGIQDRMQGGGSADAYSDRYQGGAGGPFAEDRYQGGADGGTDRDRIDLPEDAPVHPHRGTRQPTRVDELLRQVPKPVYEPVEMFRNIAGLSKRMTGIQTETADIRRRLSPALSATAPNDLSRKVSPWLKRKLPK